MMRQQFRKKRIGLTLTIIFLLLLAILVLGIQITDVTVTGNERYTDQQITDLIFPSQRERNTAYCYFKNRFRPHQQIPFVEDYKVAFNSLSHVEIIVYEKSIVGYVSYMSSYMYFDKDGIIVESANSPVAGIPRITGLKFGQIVLYQPLPVESSQVFGEILNLTQVLSIYEIAVDRIQYNSNGEATLYMDELEIFLGGNEGVNGKVAELKSMLGQLAGRSGVLYLDTYVEEGDNPMFRFEPR